MLGYDTLDAQNQPVAGAIVFDGTGMVAEDFTYEIQAGYDPRGSNRAVSNPVSTE